MSRTFKRILVGVFIFIGLIAAECIGIHLPFFDLLLYLLVGWIPFIGRTVRQTQVNWDMVAGAIVCAILLIVGSHLFLRWLHREMRRSPDAGPWRWRWTLAGFAIIVLMFTAGLAATGAGHQIVWLARSPEPMYRRGRDQANRIKCANNLRQIGLALHLYLQENGGHYPDDFRALMLAGADLDPSVFICPAGDLDLAPGATTQESAESLLKPEHCSYIYLGKGLIEPLQAPANRIVAVELPENHQNKGINALCADIHVEWLDPPAAEAALLSLGFVKVEKPAAR